MCCCSCPCCCPPSYQPYPIIYTPAMTPEAEWNMIQGMQKPKPPPADDEIWHHGYTCCNCQECCDFRNCCDCSGICYTCNVGTNSIEFFNSPYGPLYEYYHGGCCRSCFAAQFSGSSCIGSLLPCCLNQLYVVEEGSQSEIMQFKNIPQQQRLIFPSTGIQTITTGPIFTGSTGRPLLRPVTPPVSSAIIQPIPTFRPIAQPIVQPAISPGMTSRILPVVVQRTGAF